jgi:hypothetical protein
MLAVEEPGRTRLEQLKNVLMGGAIVTPEVLRQCIEELGSNGVENG